MLPFASNFGWYKCTIWIAVCGRKVPITTIAHHHPKTRTSPIKFSNQQANVRFKSRFNAQISSLFIYFIFLFSLFSRSTANIFRSIILCIKQLIRVTNQQHKMNVYMPVYLYICVIGFAMELLDWMDRTQYECLLIHRHLMGVKHEPTVTQTKNAGTELELVTVDIFVKFLCLQSKWVRLFVNMKNKFKNWKFSEFVGMESVKKNGNVDIDARGSAEIGARSNSNSKRNVTMGVEVPSRRL